MARILVIEDDANSRELAVYLLKAAGHDTYFACDGETGLDVAKQSMPDLILCDLQMHPTDGFVFIARLKKDPALAPTPVVAVTAFSMTGDRDNALAAGFHDYLSKPIDPVAFSKQVEAFLSTSHQKGKRE